MKFKVTDATNFLRVFCVPSIFPSGYCFDGGHVVPFVMVDWFNALDPMAELPIEFRNTDEWYLKHIEKLKTFIKGKKYFNPKLTYMILTDYGDVFLVNPELRAEKLQKQMDELKQ